MSNHCSCIAVFSKQVRLDEAKDFLVGKGISRNGMVIVSKTNSPALQTNVAYLLQQSGVPEGSQYCYQCVLEMGYILLIVSGSNHLVEQVSTELERLGEVDIAVHLDLT